MARRSAIPVLHVPPRVRRRDETDLDVSNRLPKLLLKRLESLLGQVDLDHVLFRKKDEGWRKNEAEDATNVSLRSALRPSRQNERRG